MDLNLQTRVMYNINPINGNSPNSRDNNIIFDGLFFANPNTYVSTYPQLWHISNLLPTEF